jgi:dienelactone hydrolase
MANGTGGAKRAGATKKARARKAPAKRRPAKRATAKRAATKRATTKRAPARKAASKRAPARKAAAKKAATKRAPARKAATKKAVARKAPAKKATAKRAPAKKTAAKKAPATKAAPVVAAPAVAIERTPTPASTPAVTPAAAPAPAAARVIRPARDPRRRSLAFTITAAVLVVAAFVLLLRLGAQQRGGPTHEFVGVGEGIPGTLYVPYDDDDGGLPTPPPKEERAPVIVMAHGYSADQASMSGLARSLTEAGYAVLTFDFRGHGSNTNRFQGEIVDDFAAAVDWAEGSPYVDGERMAVMGHSMGAGAALDFATADARPKAVIPLAGGGMANDGVVPANTLFLVAEGDPDIIHDQQAEVADTLRAAGGNVTNEEIDGTDHITILRDDDTVAAITSFLDPILEVERADGDTPGIEDPRYGTAFLYLLVALGLITMLGTVVGRFAPAGALDDPPSPVWGGFLLLIGAVFVTMPMLTTGEFNLLPIGPGQPIVMNVALASAILWGGRALARRGQLGGTVGTWLADDRPWLSLRSSAATGLAAAGVLVALLLPLTPVLHRLVPTPQRAVYLVVMTAVALPFFAAYHALIRRGTGWQSIVIGIVGRIVLLALLVLGLALGALPFVISLVIPLLVIQYVILELFAAGCYAASRNTTVVAIVDAVVIGWMATTLTPVG